MELSNPLIEPLVYHEGAWVRGQSPLSEREPGRGKGWWVGEQEWKGESMPVSRGGDVVLTGVTLTFTRGNKETEAYNTTMQTPAGGRANQDAR